MHNSKMIISIRNRRFPSLICYEAHHLENDAPKREYYLKLRENAENQLERILIGSHQIMRYWGLVFNSLSCLV